MAEIDQGVGDHGVDHTAAHGNDPAETHDVDLAAVHGVDYGLGNSEDHAVDHGEGYNENQTAYFGEDHSVQHATDPGEDNTVDYGLASATEHDFGNALDHSLGQAAEDGVDHSVDNQEEHDVDHAADHEPENIQAEENQGHDENTNAGVGEKKWPGWPGESVFRMLVPAQKVGGIIGRKGEFIKKIVEETRARIKILDGPPGTKERAVLVSAKEEPDSSLPPAVDGLLTIHKRIIDGLEADSAHAPPGQGFKVSTRLLVPASQAGILIGKHGATVKSIQEAASCLVRVLGTEDLPVFALQDDRIVEIAGEPANVHKALELIASHLRKFLVDRSIIPVFEMQMQMSNHQMEHMPHHQSWGPPPGVPPNAGGGPGFGHNPQYLPPPRQLDNYYPPPDLPPPIERQPHQGISAYGREAPLSGHASGNAQAAPSMITQITQQMQIPLSYADAVIGTGGASISYIRRASGATVAIQETRGVPGEMTAEISGTASQVQTAQQLIQNFMAEAAAAAGAAPTQTQTGGPTDQGYNPYAQGSMYASAATNQGHAGQPGGYSTNYGY